jgi:N-methylhydantoinase B
MLKGADLTIVNNMLSSICEEAGTILYRCAYSPNIKERRDFSCALFNQQGELVSQACHIPVHLGSMSFAVKEVTKEKILEEGDCLISNDPFCGGTHLPDITLVSPIFYQGELIGYFANRAHHSDIGGIYPGSMALTKSIDEEGIIIKPTKLLEKGEKNYGLIDFILENTRCPKERIGDLNAQICANQTAIARFTQLCNKFGKERLLKFMDELINYTERIMRSIILKIPKGTYNFVDFLDNNGINKEPLRIEVDLTIKRDTVKVDLTKSNPVVETSLNCALPVTVSSVYYVFRCLIPEDVPSNCGILRPIEILTCRPSLLDAQYPSAVAAGNVETSQRIVDVLFGALHQAIPQKIPAASCGSMNNLSIGNEEFVYYETIGGGMGARPSLNGISAVHTHMTNTQNTPVEVLETNYPLRVKTYRIRKNSGGKGRFRGGDGIVREIEVLTECNVSLLAERRRFAPYGLSSGEPGAKGEDAIKSKDGLKPIKAKGTYHLNPGDIISISTPGGGGFGSLKD